MREIKGFGGRYAITKDGRIWSHVRQQFKKTRRSKFYEVVTLVAPGKRKKPYYVHRLYAETYLPNPNNLPAVNHINGNRFDNRIENLEWVSHKENSRHYYRNRKRKDGGSHVFTHNGKSMTLTEWAEELGMNPTSLIARIRTLKWPVHAALSVGIIPKDMKGRRAYIEALLNSKPFSSH